MNGHKGTIGLAETQRESSWSSVGSVELNETDLSPSLSLFSVGFGTERRIWRYQQGLHKQPSMIRSEQVFFQSYMRYAGREAKLIMNEIIMR